MSLTGVAQLLGAIKIVPNVDSIGIAVFGVAGGNTMYVAETDTDFRITEFMEFVNIEGIEIDYRLPEQYQLLSYRLAEPMPMPFWIEGKCHIIAGDAEANDLFRYFGDLANRHSVLKDMRKLLSDARNGLFRQQQDQWTAEEISTTFVDIFHQTPIHSRYWVTRLGDAVRYARPLTEPPHPVDDEIRRVALDWISRFATKTDFERLMSVIGNLLDGAIISDRAQAMVFAFLVNSIHTGNFKSIEKSVIDSKYFEQLFPTGIYDYWWRNSWPFPNFRYARPRDILEPLIKEIKSGWEREDFRRAEAMSYLYFVRENAPSEINSVVAPMLNKTSADLRTAIKNLDKSLSNTSKIGSLHNEAGSVLYVYYLLMALDGVINGTHRLSRTIIDRRFGIDSFYIKEVTEIAQI